MRGVNAKYAEFRRTVEVVRAAAFIPAGSEIRPGQLEVVKVPEAVAKELGLVRDPAEAAGKAAKVSLVPGQPLVSGMLGAEARRPGFVEVHVPVDVSSSAFVVAGDVVDVYVFSKEPAAGSATLLCRGVRVLHSYDQTGMEVTPVEGKAPAQAVAPPGSKTPASVGLEVPADAAPALIQAASQKRVYLAKSGPAN